MEPNFQCMVCGWRWFVLPKNRFKTLWRACPACGSKDTKHDDEESK